MAGNIIHQIIGGPVERYTPSSGLKGSILFQEIVNFVFLGINKKQRSCDGRGARSAPLGVALNPKRRVRAVHGCARAAKNSLVTYIFILCNCDLAQCNYRRLHCSRELFT